MKSTSEAVFEVAHAKTYSFVVVVMIRSIALTIVLVFPVPGGPYKTNGNG